jgi:hypothetical protein
MANYNRKPETIEAFQVGVDEEPKWFIIALAKGEASRKITDEDIDLPFRDEKPLIRLILPRHNPIACEGDYIILHTGKFMSTLRPSTFNRIYEPAQPCPDDF